MATRQRPLGIVLITIFFGVFGILGALGSACGLIVGGGADAIMDAARQAGDQTGSAATMADMPRFGALFVVASIVGVIAAVLESAAAYGLWSFQSWGRPLGLGLAIFAIVWSLLWFFVFQLHMAGSVVIVWLLIVLAINGLIVWYLRKPEIARLYAEPTA
jgi:hypothetical protein